MKKITPVLLVLIFSFISFLSCAAGIACKYGVDVTQDKFNSNEKILMKGGIVEVDYLGIVGNVVEFNPLIIRSAEKKFAALYLKFNFESTSTSCRTDWINIRKGSTAIFLLNGSTKIILTAIGGDIDYSVIAPQNTVYTTHYDFGLFPISPDELKQIAYSDSLEIRVSGEIRTIDLPRKPNFHLSPYFIPNFKTFYELEVKPMSFSGGWRFVK